MNGKLKSNAIIVVVGILTCALISSIVLGAVTLGKVNAVAESVVSSSTEDPARENDVVISTDYVIKSTENISDAYKSCDTSGLSDRDKETLDMAKKVLDGIITDGMTPYEKELAVYDWMTHELRFETGSLLVVPENGADSDNPYGVLKFHKAVCVGYATTFRLFMQMLDIECMVVHNSERYHSWNLVKLDDEWYHTDIYSDSSTGNYTHFNLNDAQMKDVQEWNREFFPASVGYKYSYAYQNLDNCGDIYELPTHVREMMDNKLSVRAFSFDKQITEDDARIVQAMMESIQNMTNFVDEYTSLYMSWSWLHADKGYVLCVYIDGYESSDEPTVEIPEEARVKIDEAINDSFGDLTDISYEEEVVDLGREEAVG